MEPLSDRVARRTFTQAKRGYDVREIEAFLAQTVDSIRSLEAELATTHGKLNAFERAQGASKDAGLVVQDAFRVATLRRDEIIEQAKERAAAIISDAEARATRMSQSDPGVAHAEAQVIIGNAREEAGRLVAGAERRAREILRIAKAQADQEAARAVVDAGEQASATQVEYRRVAQQLRDLKSAVNQMLQEGAAGNEEIRLVFASESTPPAS
jgi:cell division septum initiation protein DivIVA